jgi:hypothetical protein
LFFCSNKRLKKKKKKSQEFDHIFILPTYQFLLVPQQVSSCCSHEAAEHGVSSPPHPTVNAKVAPRQKPFYTLSFYSMQPPPTKIPPKNPCTPELESKLPFFTTILSQKQFQHLHKHTQNQ